jgi:hypothetical protein
MRRLPTHSESATTNHETISYSAKPLYTIYPDSKRRMPNANAIHAPQQHNNNPHQSAQTEKRSLFVRPVVSYFPRNPYVSTDEMRFASPSFPFLSFSSNPSFRTPKTKPDTHPASTSIHSTPPTDPPPAPRYYCQRHCHRPVVVAGSS